MRSRFEPTAPESTATSLQRGSSAVRGSAFGCPLWGTVPSTILSSVGKPIIRHCVPCGPASPPISLPSTPSLARSLCMSPALSPYSDLSQTTFSGSCMPPPTPGVCRASLHSLETPILLEHSTHQQHVGQQALFWFSCGWRGGVSGSTSGH